MIDLVDDVFTIRTDKERLMKLQHLIAKLYGIDVTKVRMTDSAEACFEAGIAYFESVEQLDPGSWKTFLVFLPSKKGLFQNLSWPQSRQAATEKEQQKVIKEMRRKLKLKIDSETKGVVEETISQ